MVEYRSYSGLRAITLSDTDEHLPSANGPWVRIGRAESVTYAEAKIIEREGYVLRWPADASGIKTGA